MKKLVCAALTISVLLCGCTAYSEPLSAQEYMDELDTAFIDYIGASKQLYNAMESIDAVAAEEAAVDCIKVLERMEALDAPRELSAAEDKFDDALNDEMEYVERTCEFIFLRAEGRNEERLNELAELNKEYLSENRIGTAYADMLSALYEVI